MMPSRNHLCSDVGFAGGWLTPVRVATAAPGRHAVVGGTCVPGICPRLTMVSVINRRPSKILLDLPYEFC